MHLSVCFTNPYVRFRSDETVENLRLAETNKRWIIIFVYCQRFFGRVTSFAKIIRYRRFVTIITTGENCDLAETATGCNLEAMLDIAQSPVKWKIPATWWISHFHCVRAVRARYASKVFGNLLIFEKVYRNYVMNDLILHNFYNNMRNNREK